MLKATETIIRRKSNIPWQIIDQNALILTPELAEAHELNETATWLWQQLEIDSSISDLIDRMCLNFEVDSNIASDDVFEFINEMNSKGMIECL